MSSNKKICNAMCSNRITLETECGRVAYLTVHGLRCRGIWTKLLQRLVIPVCQGGCRKACQLSSAARTAELGVSIDTNVFAAETVRALPLVKVGKEVVAELRKESRVDLHDKLLVVFNALALHTTHRKSCINKGSVEG